MTISNYTRCRICNAVNHSDISDEDSELSSGGFYPYEDGFVCYECESIHREVMSDFDLDDEYEYIEDEQDV